MRERESTLDAANRQLEDKDRIKSEYVLRVTHDIKGHLAAIVSCIEAFLFRYGSALEAEPRDLITRAEKRTNSLLFFVEALLKITRMKLEENVEKEQFSLKTVVVETLQQLGTLAKSKGITLKTEIDPGEQLIEAEKISIQETVINILMNAIKYTDANGEVKITLNSSDEQYILEISDTGMGIPEDELHKIFDEFYRASNAKKTVTCGTGLGLSICKHILGRNDGEICASSKLGEGSTFTIRIKRLKNDPISV